MFRTQEGVLRKKFGCLSDEFVNQQNKEVSNQERVRSARGRKLSVIMMNPTDMKKFSKVPSQQNSFQAYITTEFTAEFSTFMSTKSPETKAMVKDDKKWLKLLKSGGMDQMFKAKLCEQHFDKIFGNSSYPIKKFLSKFTKYVRGIVRYMCDLLFAKMEKFLKDFTELPDKIIDVLVKIYADNFLKGVQRYNFPLRLMKDSIAKYINKANGRDIIRLLKTHYCNDSMQIKLIRTRDTFFLSRLPLSNPKLALPTTAQPYGPAVKALGGLGRTYDMDCVKLMKIIHKVYELIITEVDTHLGSGVEICDTDLSLIIAYCIINCDLHKIPSWIEYIRVFMPKNVRREEEGMKMITLLFCFVMKWIQEEVLVEVDEKVEEEEDALLEEEKAEEAKKAEEARKEEEKKKVPIVIKLSRPIKSSKKANSDTVEPKKVQPKVQPKKVEVVEKPKKVEVVKEEEKSEIVEEEMLEEEVLDELEVSNTPPIQKNEDDVVVTEEILDSEMLSASDILAIQAEAEAILSQSSDNLQNLEQEAKKKKQEEEEAAKKKLEEEELERKRLEQEAVEKKRLEEAEAVEKERKRLEEEAEEKKRLEEEAEAEKKRKLEEAVKAAEEEEKRRVEEEAKETERKRLLEEEQAELERKRLEEEKEVERKRKEEEEKVEAEKKRREEEKEEERKKKILQQQQEEERIKQEEEEAARKKKEEEKVKMEMEKLEEEAKKIEQSKSSPNQTEIEATTNKPPPPRPSNKAPPRPNVPRGVKGRPRPPRPAGRRGSIRRPVPKKPGRKPSQPPSRPPKTKKAAPSVSNQVTPENPANRPRGGLRRLSIMFEKKIEIVQKEASKIKPAGRPRPPRGSHRRRIGASSGSKTVPTPKSPVGGTGGGSDERREILHTLETLKQNLIESDSFSLENVRLAYKGPESQIIKLCNEILFDIIAPKMKEKDVQIQQLKSQLN